MSLRLPSISVRMHPRETTEMSLTEIGVSYRNKLLSQWGPLGGAFNHPPQVTFGRVWVLTLGAAGGSQQTGGESSAKCPVGPHQVTATVWSGPSRQQSLGWRPLSMTSEKPVRLRSPQSSVDVFLLFYRSERTKARGKNRNCEVLEAARTHILPCT